MKVAKGLLYLSLGWLAVTLSACASGSGSQPPHSPLSVAVLASGRLCLEPPDGWTATWIDSPDQLGRFFARCRANRIGFNRPAVPAVDFKRFGVVAIEMGQQPSAGYGLDADKVMAHLENQSAILTLTVQRPAPGAVTAQMVTTPWILVRMPKGPFRTIRVVDQNFRLLTQIEKYP